DVNAITTSADRIIPNLTITTDLARGASIKWQSRYKNLADELTEISELTGLGWSVALDYVNQTWVFDVAEGRDLTTSQAVNPPVIFAPQFDSLKTLEYATSDLNYRSVAYVAGQGEGADRRVITTGGGDGLSR